MHTIALAKMSVDGATIAYRRLGSGPAVLLLHGWPTSSYLWRNVMPTIAQRNQVIAMDLPGFGESDKPVNARYTFGHFARAIEGLMAALEIDRFAIGGHDLGGPIAAHYTLSHPADITGLALLNTQPYPDFPPEVIDFVRRLRSPAERHTLTGRDGLTEVFRQGVVDPAVVTPELVP